MKFRSFLYVELEEFSIELFTKDYTDRVYKKN